jgi:hypothetical protein
VLQQALTTAVSPWYAADFNYVNRIADGLGVRLEADRVDPGKRSTS